MPHLRLNDGHRLFYTDTGGDGPVVLFSHGLLFTHAQFAAQIEALRGRYRCVAYDHLGQGQSDVPPGPVIPIERNYEDCVALIEGLHLGPVHFVGLSMGGFVGMRLAARRPAWVRSLCLMNTTAEPEPAENLLRYRLLVLAQRTLGPRLISGPIAKIMLSRSFLEDPARAEARQAVEAGLRAVPRSIYKACRGVFTREGVEGELARVRCPTLVMAGEEDLATVPEKSVRIAARIHGSALVSIPRAGHSSAVEHPEAVTAFLSAFLDAQPT